MKTLIVVVFAAAVAMPAWAQDLANTPVVPSEIPGLPYGFKFASRVGGDPLFWGAPLPQQFVQQYTSACWDRTASTGTQSSPGQCSPAQIAAGGYQVIEPEPQNRIEYIPKLALAQDSMVGVNFSGFYRDPASPAGITYITGSVPLSAFARAEAVDALLASQQSLADDMRRNQLQALRGIALTSSLNFAAPLSGTTNRLALGTASYNGQGAMSVNYSHRSGNLDYGVAAAFAKGESLGKAGVGFNW